jgi:hypothetical protein
VGDAKFDGIKMTQFWSSAMQSLGLIADITGAILLFKFGLPPISRTGGANFLELANSDSAKLEKERKFDHYGKLGLFSLVTGFVLQLIPNAIMVVSGWRG